MECRRVMVDVRVPSVLDVDGRMNRLDMVARYVLLEVLRESFVAMYLC